MVSEMVSSTQEKYCKKHNNIVFKQLLCFRRVLLEDTV